MPVEFLTAGYEALTRARLVHVDQYYLRADTIAAANLRLISARTGIPVVRFGERSCSPSWTGCASR
ncbi:hypothetical protein GCM10010280_16660 [Streptomyces pilosus]|uniref:Uncharacterized protein n=1 Tax=Streptomyces pilosus TaxID=28893 RepID=A0A918ETP3_9ACTN|nr:transposase [Streptomyces pilosus]GGQ70746.1 hypothetical protein GCM10010280_16660 [Streptomyces pilosus]